MSAIVEAALDFGPQLFKPCSIAQDAPVPVHLHDPAELTIGCSMKGMSGGTNRKRRSKDLMPSIVLAFVEFSFAECSF
jgi:hypothetical protein